MNRYHLYIWGGVVFFFLLTFPSRLPAASCVEIAQQIVEGGGGFTIAELRAQVQLLNEKATEVENEKKVIKSGARTLTKTEEKALKSNMIERRIVDPEEDITSAQIKSYYSNRLVGLGNVIKSEIKRREVLLQAEEMQPQFPRVRRRELMRVIESLNHPTAVDIQAVVKAKPLAKKIEKNRNPINDLYGQMSGGSNEVKQALREKVEAIDRQNDELEAQIAAILANAIGTTISTPLQLRNLAMDDIRDKDFPGCCGGSCRLCPLNRGAKRQTANGFLPDGLAQSVQGNGNSILGVPQKQDGPKV